MVLWMFDLPINMSILCRTPFFRWDNSSESDIYDQAHFIISISMYDTLYSFTAILLGSLVTDNHHMTDKERVNFMASGKILNLFAALFVARFFLEIFDTDNMHQFRIFLVALALFVAVLFLISQIMIHYHVVVHWKAMRIRFLDIHRRQNYTPKRTKKLKPYQVIHDFWRYHNFWAWIGMGTCKFYSFDHYERWLLCIFTFSSL